MRLHEGDCMAAEKLSMRKIREIARLHFSLGCKELHRKHVTKTLLWQEYREQHADGVGYSQFCEYYARWLKGVTVVMRQEHRVGEKMFVDFSGDGIDIVSTTTGEVVTAK